MPVWLLRRRVEPKRLLTYVLINDPTDERIMDVALRFVERAGEPIEAIEITDSGTERVIGEAWDGS